MHLNGRARIMEVLSTAKEGAFTNRANFLLTGEPELAITSPAKLENSKLENSGKIVLLYCFMTRAINNQGVRVLDYLSSSVSSTLTP